MLLPIVRFMQTGQAELGEAAIGEVADADDAHRGQVARAALGQ